MTLLKLPLVLAIAMVLRGVDAACVEDNCYRAMYWNPAGAEECSTHFITTIIPPPSTSTVTVTSGIGDITTITGSFVAATTIIPSDVIPTYIVRACYGDVSYRFESACSCIGAGPTTTTIPPVVATDTVVVPSLSQPSISTPPLITPLPIDGGGMLPEPLIVGPGLEPACLAVGQGSVVVTVQVAEFFAMSVTVSGPAFCIGDPTMPPAPSSQCNCASTLPSAPFSSSSFTRLAISNTTSSSDTFSTVFRTSYTATSTAGFSNYSISRSTRATPESTLTSLEPTSTPETSEFESSTSSRSFQPFETRNVSSTAEPSTATASSSEEPSSTAEPSTATASSSVEPSSTAEPSTATASSSVEASSSLSSSAEPSGPTSFVPVGPELYIRITAGAYAGSYIETDEPDGTITTNLRNHVTTDIEMAAVWVLDRETGILFQQIGDAWWGAYFAFGVRASWSSILLVPADEVIGWLTAPVAQREALRCKIDYMSDFLLTCGTHGWTTIMESDRCGWTVTTPLNPLLDRGCPNSQEMIMQAVVIYPDDGESISK